MIRALLAAAALLLAVPAIAQEAAPPAPAPAAPKPATVKVKLTTAEGPIVLELEKERAPITTANFLKYVDSRKFDGITFYRAMTFPGRPDLGLIQGGAKSDVKRMLPPIAHEPTSKTGLTHDNGAISMARGAPGTAQADFFIIVGGLPSLDASSAPGGDPGYAVFGHVVEGMDVVMKILAAPTSATEGVGVMKGQMIAKPIPVTSARRTD